MTRTGEDLLQVLDRLIAQAEEKRVDQMLHIATLLAEGEDVADAEDGLRQIVELLGVMREQRLIHQQTPESP